MMKLYFLLIALIIFSTAPAQTRLTEGEVQNCKVDTSNLAHPRFPIQIDSNNVGTIEIISFNKSWLTTKNKINFSKTNIDLSSILQLKKISNKKKQQGIIELFQNGYVSDTVRIGGGMLCYNPRNAIIIYDAQNRISLIIEICFECRNYKLYSENKSQRGLCKGTLDELFKFFKNEGIEYGITKK